MKDILAVNTHTTSRAHQDHITIQSEGLIEDQKVGLAKDPTTLYKVPTDLQRTEGDKDIELLIQSRIASLPVAGPYILFQVFRHEISEKSIKSLLSHIQNLLEGIWVKRNYEHPAEISQKAKDTFHDPFQIRSLRFNKVVTEEKFDRLTKIVVPCLPEDGEWWDGHVPLLTKRHQDGSIDRPYKYEAMDPIKFHL
ncbi:hypothetical protein HBI23_141060 [Parastagonospora nodorum]|nr:hypothetical protein HBI79_126880 [Parastagonospora nodorum]KAH5247607.1 hypothetical protein HBI71_175030 [Parastagonospora nodorum]KAH5415637.1 hypothetical protein HBI47_147560 [Parastagonospora nodorum]KAH5657937.1 hypothetical protein HBI23_141060 [Parastagonospora nodorum]